MKATLLALFTALAFSAGTLRAQEEPAPTTPQPAPQVQSAQTLAPMAYKSGGTTATLTLYLVLLLGLFAGGAYLLRNGFTLFQPKIKGARKLQISEMRMLGNRQFLVVAEYEDRKMLLGVCPGRIDYLTNLAVTEPEFSNLSPEKGDE
jgi:flagellar protein FliO/FliZ